MGTITLSDKQQRRAEILSRAASNQLTRQQAAQLLGITDRQVRRLLARYQEVGLKSVVHANTGRTPVNKTSAALRDKLATLAGKDGAYHDFNTCHLQELLAEREQLCIGRSTLDRLLKEAGVRKRKRGRPRRLFHHRERVGREGDMLLTDASLHDWLEGRDPRHKDKNRKLSLIGAVDDATSGIAHLRFWPTECQAGYICMAREVTSRFGVPQSFYHDRHTILCSPKEPTIEDELAGREPKSQFQAILSQLGAQAIQAMTPQAKGRIERMWQTLQDRLIKEMRLSGIKTLEEANAFLPGFIERYNARFGVASRDPNPAWVKPEAALDQAYYFAAKEERVVRADHTLSWRGKTILLQRKKGERSLAGARVQVHTTPEGERFVYSGKEQLRTKELDGPLPRVSMPKPQLGSIQEALTAPEPENDEERRQARKRQMAHLHAGVLRA